MPGQLYQGNCNYTAISTLGTTTVNAGANAANPGAAGAWGVFYGFNVLSTGTAGVTVTAIDIVINPTGGGTSTNTLYVATGTAPGQVLAAAPAGLGVRYKGSLVIVTSGTAGTINAMWD